MVYLSFHGAAGTVTGSRYLLEVGDRKLLIDCGMFQGVKQIRKRNWDEPEFAPRDVDTVLLTHAHLDHTGWLPRLDKLGFQGKVLATRPTIELTKIVLADAARLQEEDAKWANKKGYSRHKPALPLFDREDADRVCKRLTRIPLDEWNDLGDGIRARWRDSGHLLGACLIQVEIDTPDGTKRLTFSGDIGRFDFPLHVDPEPRPASDVLVMESTYGGRRHPQMKEEVFDVVGRALEGGGTVLVPAFALGRSQLLALLLLREMDAGNIPQVPIHLDSPMAIRASKVYYEHLDEKWVDEDVACCEDDFLQRVKMHSSTDESKELNRKDGPRVIIAGSGMLTGGRILHHLSARASDPKNLALLVGYQAEGTRGRRLLRRERFVRIHGRDIPIHCQVAVLNGLSGHADEEELLRWYDTAGDAPAVTYVTHGEPKAAAALQERLTQRGAPRVIAPEIGDRFEV